MCAVFVGATSFVVWAEVISRQSPSQSKVLSGWFLALRLMLRNPHSATGEALKQMLSLGPGNVIQCDESAFLWAVSIRVGWGLLGGSSCRSPIPPSWASALASSSSAVQPKCTVCPHFPSCLSSPLIIRHRPGKHTGPYNLEFGRKLRTLGWKSFFYLFLK